MIRKVIALPCDLHELLGKAHTSYVCYKETELNDCKVSLKFPLKDIISRLPLFPKLFPTPKPPTLDVFSLLLDSPGSEKVQIQLKLFKV